jgi:hypothetical protein
MILASTHLKVSTTDNRSLVYPLSKGPFLQKRFIFILKRPLEDSPSKNTTLEKRRSRIQELFSALDSTKEIQKSEKSAFSQLKGEVKSTAGVGVLSQSLDSTKIEPEPE